MVYTRAAAFGPRPQADAPSPVQQFAEGAGLPVGTPANFKSAEEREAFAALDADAAVVVAVG
ncbi:MAG: hypothetical protein R3C58_12505 [Parvularculaceae bacterium]